MDDGRYDLVFSEKYEGIGSAIKSIASFLVPSFQVGKTYGDENGRKITIVAINDIDNVTGTGSITFDLVNGVAAPQEAGVWAVGIFTLIGLALAAFTVVEIRKLVPKETINLALIAIIAVSVFAFYKFYWKK